MREGDLNYTNLHSFSMMEVTSLNHISSRFLFYSSLSSKVLVFFFFFFFFFLRPPRTSIIGRPPRRLCRLKKSLWHFTRNLAYNCGSLNGEPFFVCRSTIMMGRPLKDSQHLTFFFFFFFTWAWFFFSTMNWYKQPLQDNLTACTFHVKMNACGASRGLTLNAKTFHPDLDVNIYSNDTIFVSVYFSVILFVYD